MSKGGVVMAVMYKFQGEMAANVVGRLHMLEDTGGPHSPRGGSTTARGIPSARRGTNKVPSLSGYARLSNTLLSLSRRTHPRNWSSIVAFGTASLAATSSTGERFLHWENSSAKVTLKESSVCSFAGCPKHQGTRLRASTFSFTRGFGKSSASLSSSSELVIAKAVLLFVPAQGASTYL